MIWTVTFAAAVGAGWILGRGDVSENLRAASAQAPVDLLAALLGVMVGFYGRERIRLRRTYASPALAYLGKRVLLGSLIAAAVYVLAPVAWGPSCLHVFASAAALGVAVWLGNLPSKL